ncbi:MAG: hypothetical protein WDO56_06035 [Gammaproteobacteria bacterium]
MKRSRIVAEVYESAAAMRRSGTIDEKTMREFDELMFPALDKSARKRVAKKLTVAMEDRNPRVFLTALGAVIEAIGLEPAAQRLGVTSASLARVVGPKAKPSFEEVRAVVSGLGFRWGVATLPTEKAKPSRVRSPRTAIDIREGKRLRSGEGARRLAALGGSEAKAKRRHRSEHDTQHITPAGRSVLLDLAAHEAAAAAGAKSGSREGPDSDDVPEIAREWVEGADLYQGKKLIRRGARAARADGSRPRNTAQKRR